MRLKKSTKVTDNSFNDAVKEAENSNFRQFDTSDPIVSEDGYVHDEPMFHGYTDEEGVFHDTFSYREMDGRDEEAIEKGDVKSNGAKLANVLVERCVNQIGTLTKKSMGSKKWGTLIRKLNGAEIDYMMVKIRGISKGKIIKFTHKCPKCGSKLITEVDVDNLPSIPYGGSDECSFSLPGRGYKDRNGKYHKDGVLRIANGLDREVTTPILAKNRASGVTSMLTRLMKFNDGAPVFADNVKEMSIKDRDYLTKLLEDNAYGVDITLEDLQCTTCGADISGERGTSDFF